MWSPFSPDEAEDSEESDESEDQLAKSSEDGGGSHRTCIGEFWPTHPRLPRLPWFLRFHFLYSRLMPPKTTQPWKRWHTLFLLGFVIIISYLRYFHRYTEPQAQD